MVEVVAMVGGLASVDVVVVDDVVVIIVVVVAAVVVVVVVGSGATGQNEFEAGLTPSYYL